VFISNTSSNETIPENLGGTNSFSFQPGKTNTVCVKDCVAFVIKNIETKTLFACLVDSSTEEI